MPLTDIVLAIVAGLIRVIIIPAILLGLLILSWRVSRTPADHPHAHTSNVLALWLGLVLFVITVTLDITSGFLGPSDRVDAYSQPLLYIILGCAIGMLLMGLVDRFASTRGAPVFVTAISASSLISLYAYLFIDYLRQPLVLLALSILAGCLVYAVFFPEKIAQFFTNRY